MRRGQLDAALRDVDAAIAKHQDNAQWAARFRVQKSHVLMLRGFYAEAMNLLSDPLPPSLARTDTEVQRKMVQGLAENYLQQFGRADQAISDAENLAVAIDSPLLGDVAQARGTIELNEKKYPQAGASFRKALAIARKQSLPSREVLALGSLGNVAMGEEHYDQAIEWFRLALQKAQAAQSVSSVSKALGNIGWNYSVVGDFDNAEGFLADAEKKSAEAGLVGDQTYWLNSLAGVYFQQHRYREANSLAQKAYRLAKDQDDQGTVTQCLNTLSDIALATGSFDDAEKFNREATEIENAGLDQFGINYSRLITGRIDTGKHDSRAAEASFRKVLADPKAETPLKWEAHARLAEMYAAQQQPAKAEQEFKLAVRTVENARKSVQRDEFRVSFLSSAIAFYDSYVNFLIDQKRPLDALKVADLSRAQSLEQSLAAAPAASSNSSRLSNLLDATRSLNATPLFYWLGEHHSWLWVITPAKTSLFPLPPSSVLDTLVKTYRDSFTDPRDPVEAGNSDGKKLYATLVQPAEKLIPKNGRVIILPDGSLNSLNFETLIVTSAVGARHAIPNSTPAPGDPAGKTSTAPPHYWIEDVTLLTANSLALLSRSSVAAPPRDGRLLAVGQALPASPEFPPLPLAEKEINLLGNYFGKMKRMELTGASATATRFLSSQPEKFAYLHFATHGTSSRLRPLESAIILSPEGDSYKLYARDVVQHPLNAYLVTISACNGAGTRTYAGEGLVGLSWAFLRAGAHNVIAGLWEVSNASTPQLMDELYKNLRAGQDPASALRNAKLTLVHSSGNYRKPFYWAPFLLYSGS
jgi:Uncharacterized protein conserved in bacteria